jgi:hypothetical protein
MKKKSATTNISEFGYQDKNGEVTLCLNRETASELATKAESEGSGDVHVVGFLEGVWVEVSWLEIGEEEPHGERSRVNPY